VEVPYASSGATGEASQTRLDRGHNAEMELISPPFSGDSHSLSYPLHFHCLYIHFLISSLITLHSLFIRLSFPGTHFTLHCCPSTGPIFLFPLHLLPCFLSTNPQLVLSFLNLYFISLHSSALLFTPQAYVLAHTNNPSRIPFCSSNSSFQNMPQYLCYVHSVAICTCLPCMCPFCLL